MLNLVVPSGGQRMRTPPLHGSSDALVLAELALRARPLLVVSETAADAQRLLEEIPFFAPRLRVHLFPDWETLPYDHFSPHHDLVSERLATLYQLLQDQIDIALVPITTALQRLCPVEYLAGSTFFFRHGDTLLGQKLREQLVRAGYSHVTQVIAPGEYSFRGGLIDIFPMGSPLPYRIDLLDDQIDTIRTFDVDTQRSIYKVNEVRLLPAREFPLDEAAQTRFRRSFREKFEGDPSRSTVYRDVSKGIPSAGVEYFLPLFFDSSALITDYVPAAATICLHGDTTAAIERFWSDTHARYAMVRGDRANPVPPPHDLFLTTDGFFGAIKSFARIELPRRPSASAVAPPPTQPPTRGGA
jgi:transcription-repair coupling factor (superfamily II helicase)